MPKKAGAAIVRHDHVGQAPACVWGEIDLVRALGVAGIHSVVVARAGDFARYSRFTVSSIDLLDTRHRSEALLERLITYGRSSRFRPVLYYDSDGALLFISRNREVLADVFRFVVPRADLVEDLVDKARFQRLAEELHLPVPPSTVLSGGLDAKSSPGRFPVVVKPVPTRSEAWNSMAHGKAIHVESQDELDALATRLRDAGVTALAQYAVPGPESLIESYHAYVGHDGEVVGEFTGRKLRTYPRQFGYSTAVEIRDIPDLVEVSRSMMMKLRFTGVAKFDFKRHPSDGSLYLLEINARFNLWHYPGAAAGVNLPALVYADLTGGRRPASLRAHDGVTWSNPWHDLRAVRSEGQSVVRWIPWFIASDTKHAFAWDDPAPLFRGALARLGERTRPLIRRDTRGD